MVGGGVPAVARGAFGATAKHVVGLAVGYQVTLLTGADIRGDKTVRTLRGRAGKVVTQLKGWCCAARLRLAVQSSKQVLLCKRDSRLRYVFTHACTWVAQRALCKCARATLRAHS